MYLFIGFTALMLYILTEMSVFLQKNWKMKEFRLSKWLALITFIFAAASILLLVFTMIMGAFFFPVYPD